MDHFEYHNGDLVCEAVPVHDLVPRFGTPLYVYSAATLALHLQRMQTAFAPLDPLICFSIKSCPNLHILRFLAERGSGFDVVSGGELARALHIGAPPGKIVYAGVGKTSREIATALEAGIRTFNVESESELEQLIEIGRALSCRPTLALRVNPDVDPHTHEYTTTGRKETKFGVDIERAAGVFRRYARAPEVRLTGIHLHLGSPVNELVPYERAIARALDLIDQLRHDGYDIDTLDIGGGFGAHYRGGEAPAAADYARVIVPLLQGRGLRVILEPGRSIAANAGILVTRVLHTKQSGARRFIIVDAAMTDLIRPALYGAFHFVWPVHAGVRLPLDRRTPSGAGDLLEYDIVGPVCESGDFLARERRLPPVERGELLAIFTAGAYGMSMASQYNSRPRPAEVLVQGDSARLIRRRETFEDLIAPELV